MSKVLLPDHYSPAKRAFQHIDTRKIWEVATGRYGMDRTRPPGERWHWESFPPCKQILDAWQAPSHQVRQVVIRAGSQTWKTAVMLIALAWSIKHRPVPKLWLTAKDDLAKDISMERLIPTLQRSPDLKDLLLDGRLDMTTWKVRTKLCTIDVAGADSATSLEQNPYGEIFSDECRNYKPGRVQKLKMRQRSFTDAKRALFSTPSMAGDEFDQECMMGSQNEWVFPCAKCGEKIALVWDKKYSRLPDWLRKKSMFTFEKDTNLIWLECQCGHRHMDDPATRRRILDSGEWITTNLATDPQHRDMTIESFHYPAQLNPRVSWADTLKGFRTAISLKNAGNVEDLKLWVNETLGEPWREGQHIEDSEVVKASYKLADVNPASEFQFVFMTIDVGLREFWHVVRGWNEGAQTRLLSAGKVEYWQDLKTIAERFGLVLTGRNSEGLAEGLCRRVFIDANWEDPKTQEVHRTAAEMGWTALIGDGKPYFEVKWKDGNEDKIDRFVYSEPRYYDSKTGVGGDRSLVGIEIRISDPTCQDILDELLAGRVGKFEYPTDIEDVYAIHMRNEPKLSRVSPKDGQIEFYRKRTGDQHLRDCEKMGVAAAAMAGVVAALPIVRQEENQ